MNCFQKTNRDIYNGIKAITAQQILNFLIFVATVFGLVGYIMAGVFFFKGYLEVNLFSLAGIGSMAFIVLSAVAIVYYLIQLQNNCETAREEAE